MKVLITGGAGFIGSNLVRSMLCDPLFEIRVLDDLSTGTRANLPPDGTEGFDFHQGSILDDRQLDDAVRGCDSIVHLAAMVSVPASVADPLRCHEINATGTLRVLDAAKRHGVRQMILASSSAVYGAHQSCDLRETDWVRPLSPYGASKLAAEAYVLAGDIPAVVLRLFNVYGPEQPDNHPYAAVVPRFVRDAVSNATLTIHGDGGQTRDFVHVYTVCDALRTALLRGGGHAHPVNLACGESFSLHRIVGTLEGIVGHELEVRYAPQRPGDIQHSGANVTALHELYPDVDPVSLDRGLANLVRLYREDRS